MLLQLLGENPIRRPCYLWKGLSRLKDGTPNSPSFCYPVYQSILPSARAAVGVSHGIILILLESTLLFHPEICVYAQCRKVQ